MNAVTEFDVGPLNWVKNEIDLALGRADQALQQFTGSGDLTQLKFCRTHLHQVQGALTIVGLDGVTQFAESVEAMLEAVELQQRPADEAIIALAQRALAMIGAYLDDLTSGQPNQPLRLLSLYREVQAARGLERVAATDLFFPDLTVRPPPREIPAKSLAHADLQSLLRQQRPRFQRGFLAWLRSPQDRSGINEMLAAVKRIEQTQDAPSARSFWWVATALLSALAEGTLAPETNAKQLCVRIDLQIRRLFEGSKNVAERLLRDALYLVASADSGSDAVQGVKDAYQLQDLIPASDAQVPAPQETVRRRLRELISATEESWSRYCVGSVQSLPVFRENANALSAAIELLGHTDFRRLAQAIAAAANWLGDDNTRHSDALAMEVATAILLAQNAQDDFRRLGGDFAHQVDVTVARIHGCIAGSPPQPGSEIPLLDEMSRRAQEKMLVGHVAKEIQSNLGQIEQVLDGFFRDADKRADLASLDVPFRQVAGALSMMRHDGAVVAVRECAAEIKRFVDGDYTPLESDFERVANQLSLIGFFIDTLPHGDSDFDDFVRQMQPAPPTPADELETAANAAGISVEQDVQRQKLETHALLDALKAQPDDQGLREEIKVNLSALKKDADLVADRALGEQTSAMLSMLASGADAAPQIDQVMATLKPPVQESLKPSAETIQLAQASSEEVDAELLEIFLEEANEVLATIDEQLRLLTAQPHKHDLLTTLRRAFHTLKGSGRMVGLKDLGEAAWAVEQTLNLWLRQELDVGAPILDLLTQAHTVFAEWVEYLENRSANAPDAGPMIDLAASLRRGSDEGQDVPLASAPTPTPVVEAPAVEAEVPTLELEVPAVELEVPTLEPEVPPEELEIPALELEAPVAEPEVPAMELEIPAVEPEFSVAELEIPAVEADAPAAEPEVPASQPEASVAEGAEHAQELVKSAEIITLNFPSAPAVSADGEFAVDLEAIEIAAVEIDSDSALVEDSSAVELAEPDDAALPAAEGQLRISISPTLYEIFSEEARAHLTTLQTQLAVLEADQTAPTPHEMYRAAHTLAGISATVGITPLNQLGLELERTLLRRDNSAQRASLEALGMIRQAVGELDLILSGLTTKREHDVPAELLDALRALYPANLVAALESAADHELAAEAPAPSEAALPQLAKTVAAPPALVQVRQIDDEIDEQLLPIFLEEALDLTQGIGTQLRAWRSAPADPEIVRTLERLLHTLKGSARMAGAMNLGEIAHAIESRVEQANRAGSAAPEVIDEIDTAFDAVLHIIERLQSGETLDQQPAEPVAAADGVELADERPAERAARPGKIVEKTAEGETDAASQHATLRVRADLIDRLANEAGELSIARARIEGEMRSLKGSLLDLTENVIRLRRQLREIEIQAESQMQSRSAQADELHAGFDPLEFDRFTRFQELTRMMAESVNDVATVQQSLLKNLDDADAAILAQARLNREVQQQLMSVRMVPFGNLADRLYRIVRQTSKELGKRANLDITGGQVELDRSVLDTIGAPLEHMLRNAIVHGLEERDVRVAQGKSAIGELSLALKQEGNEIILTFADDGAGLDFERIRERAIATGLLAVDDDADSERLAGLIFTPGFSTASELSQVAGRGVGMDVVKTEVTRLGGRIEVLSTPSQGTEFRLYIPLTLALTKALLVRTGTRNYAIPSVMIEQVLDLKDVALTRIRDAGSAEWMGQSYPFNYLPHLLGDTEALPEQRRQYWVLLLSSGTRRIAVQVDELLGNEEIVVKNIGPQLARVIGVDGATVLANGQVVLILNPVALSTRTPVAEFAAPVPTVPVHRDGEFGAAKLPTVMVVDDSLTVRKIAGRLLARDGYQVIDAKDGVDALEQLLDVVPDVMLVDIEMPRMDGFDLTRNIRADARLKGIPIIMITSRTAEKHRAYAFELGVNDYLGKPYQEDELLRLVAGYVAQRRLTTA